MRTVIIGLLLASAPGALFAADAQAGKTVFDAKCKMCHAADGKGNPAIAKALNVTLRPLGSAEVQAKSDADLKKDSTSGTGKMKPVKLTDAQSSDVVAFIRTLK